MALSTSGTQALKNTAPAVTDYPITVGCWVRPAAAGNVFRSIWQLSKAADPSDRFAMYQWTGSVWNTLVSVGNSDTSCTGGTVTATSWHYIVSRFISATNRRIDVLNANGSTAHAQNTTSAAPASQAEINIAADTNVFDQFSGLIADLWYANADVQVDGAALSDATLRQLAYGGPFSLPSLVANIQEYRSFRKHPFLNEAGEVYFGARGVQNWTPTATPTIGFHPPLPYWYRRPTDASRELMI
jgi:hypothetical protein